MGLLGSSPVYGFVYIGEAKEGRILRASYCPSAQLNHHRDADDKLAVDKADETSN